MPLAGQIRDDSVPDIDDDRNSAPPPHPFLLQLESEAYEKLEHAMERADGMERIACGCSHGPGVLVLHGPCAIVRGCSTTGEGAPKESGHSKGAAVVLAM